MKEFFNILRNRARKNSERDRSLNRPVEAFSRLLWPYSESKLAIYVGILALLDFSSTFSAIGLNHNNQIVEAGLLPSRALHTGGFSGLFILDVLYVGALICLAIGIRHLFRKYGFSGFGRAAFVLVLSPYLILAMATIFNNIFLAIISNFLE